MGRMADSRAERRWSKEPRIETMLSVIVWLFCSDSLIRVAFLLNGSSTATPISPASLSPLLELTTAERKRGEDCHEGKGRS